MAEAKLSYVQLQVSDLDRAIEFYEGIFALKLVERIDDRFAFLSGGENHHEIALQAVPSRARPMYRYSPGLYHVGFQVPDRRALAQTYQQLKERGICAATVNHQMSWAIYFTDPDGNGLAIFCDTRSELRGEKFWRGCNVELSEAQLLAALHEHA